MKERLDKELSSIRTSIKGNTKSHNELSRSVIKRLSTSAKENSTLIEQQAAGNEVIIVSSEGALIAIASYDYPAAAAQPLFENTLVLNNNFNPSIARKV